MSLRLTIASRWMPRFLMSREVQRIEARTNATLDALLRSAGSHPPEGTKARAKDLEGHRAAMAGGHEIRVRALIDALGREEAIRAARSALNDTGMELGREAKASLGVGGSSEDLMRAAAVMYRILGIEFSVLDTPDGRRMAVRRCALSQVYSHDACLMLSAVDEGVVSGLNPMASMRFTERMTGGAPCCLASITLKEGT
ncbi:MAG: hypothetical protein SA339_02590 [Methanomassiliicoccus sp.]|nr:hypothetical protein [Methanomassiliicoccus sp.]